MGIRDKIVKTDEGKALEVIAKGGHVLADNEEKKKADWINFCLRIKTKTLERIEKVVEEREGISKTGWILEAIQKELKRAEDE